MPQTRNRLQELPRDECLRRLRRGGIGRVAVTVGALPAVFPVNYATLDDDVIFRSAPGAKLTAAARGAVVAFEIDAIDAFAHTGWSVLVIGPARHITDDQELARARAVPLSPWAGGERDIVVRIETQLVSGRSVTNVAATQDSPALPVEICPACGGGTLSAVSDGEATNFLCATCFSCWHVGFGMIYRVPATTCPGCRLAELCQAAHLAEATQSTHLAEATHATHATHATGAAHPAQAAHA